MNLPWPLNLTCFLFLILSPMSTVKTCYLAWTMMIMKLTTSTLDPTYPCVELYTFTLFSGIVGEWVHSIQSTFEIWSKSAWYRQRKRGEILKAIDILQQSTSIYSYKTINLNLPHHVWWYFECEEAFSVYFLSFCWGFWVSASVERAESRFIFQDTNQCTCSIC